MNALTQENIVHALVQLGNYLDDENSISPIVQQSYQKNNWFIPSFTKYMLQSIREDYLTEKRLKNWLDSYEFTHQKKKVAIIMAGNIPAVGFFDLMSVLLSGHIAVVKLSSKDEVLIKHFIEKLVSFEKALQNRIEIVEKLDDYDAVIATGSDSSHALFSYYFGKKPHVLRKNRNSVALIGKNISDEKLRLLADDMMMYFGLGCRNVSKIFIEEGFEINRIFEAMGHYKFVKEHVAYMNNFDYNLSIRLLNKEVFYHSDFLIFLESAQIQSRIAELNFAYFNDLTKVNEEIINQKDMIQCVVSDMQLNNIKTVSFGKSQFPQLNDYADGVDVMDFLQKL